MRKLKVSLYAIILVMIFVLCIPAPAALAVRQANAESTWVNGVELTAAAPYLANGSAAASAVKPGSGGYAYFNAATSTLTLHNAIVDQAFIISSWGSVKAVALVYATGNLALVLEGNNKLYYNSGANNESSGIYVEGGLTINGTGSAAIEVMNTNSNSESSGITAQELTIESGSLSITVESTSDCHGLDAVNDLLIAGGQTVISVTSPLPTAVMGGNCYVRITGGSITATAQAASLYAVGLYAEQVFLEGGEGSFSAVSPVVAAGMVQNVPVVFYSGGNFTFNGGYSALANQYTSGELTYNISGGKVYVAENFNGSGKRLWTSAADGMLASDTSAISDFQYVQFISDSVMPQTGDSATPWLWAGIAGACLLLAGGVLLIAKRKRSA